MTSSLEDLVAQFSQRELPPVETWQPTRQSTIDIVIDAQANWHYRGSIISRKRMVAMFSSILMREQDDYFLITPQEKLKIEVQDAPFMAVLLDIEGEGEQQMLHFTDNTGNVFTAGENNRLYTDKKEKPYVIVRRNLPALISRSVYMQLADYVEEGSNGYGVWSDKAFFRLGN